MNSKMYVLLPIVAAFTLFVSFSSLFIKDTKHEEYFENFTTIPCLMKYNNRMYICKYKYTPYMVNGKPKTLKTQK